MSYLAPGAKSSGADFLRRFRPCVANYIVSFRYSTPDDRYFITPGGSYSTRIGTPPYGLDVTETMAWYIGTVQECEAKLDRDLALLALSGFNTIRFGICPILNPDTPGVLTFPIWAASSRTVADYLSLLKVLLQKIASHGLKAIILIGPNGQSPNGAQWEQPDLYRDFLGIVCGALRDNPTILAYDLYNEPAWLYPPGAIDDLATRVGRDWIKLATSHWVADSYWTIKSVAPDQLVTIGLTDPPGITGWDPALIPVDFISYHFYPSAGLPVSDANQQFASLLYWAKQTSLRPWIIGETGFAGKERNGYPFVVDTRVGSEQDQQTYADLTLQRSLDCGCDGYSWWQYQEVKWGNDFGDYLGLVTKTNLDPNPTPASEQQKPALSSFSPYQWAVANPTDAVKPSIYANLNSKSNPILTGKVVDPAGNPLADATVKTGRRIEFIASSVTAASAGVTTTITTALPHGIAVGEKVIPQNVLGLAIAEYDVTSVPGQMEVTISVGSSGTYVSGGIISRVLRDENSTLSEPDGNFTVSDSYPTAFIASGTLEWGQVSKPGYSVTDPLVTPNNCVLEPVRDAAWSRRWMANNPGKLNFDSVSGLPDWTINSSDRFYTGDFDGDGYDELLCVSGASDLMIMLRFDGSWREVWTNGSNPSQGGGIYPYRQQLIIGDFDGDGADEVLGSDATGDWLTVFKYQNLNWQWMASSGGNQNHPLKPYRNDLKIGDFNGSGGVFLLGVAGGWTTLFRFDPVANDWQWVDSDYGTTNDSSHSMSMMRPYANDLVIGDFDGDGRDEVLGFGATGPTPWITLFGLRNGNSFQWLTSNNGSTEAAMAGMVPYLGKLVVGGFDGPARDTILGISNQSGMFGFDGEDFQRVWSSVRNSLAGLVVKTTDRLIPFRPRKEMPGYLLIMPDAGKASMIAFDPLLRRT